MKKSLLFTSALVGAAAVVSVAGSAEAKHYRDGAFHNDTHKYHVHRGNFLDITLGGFIDFQAGFSDQESDFEDGYRDLAFQNDTEIHFHIEGETEDGVGYGAVIELEADVTEDADGEGVNADKTYIFVDSDAGRVELGNTESVAQRLKVDASTIARATGGVDGDYYDFADVNGFINVSDTAAGLIGGVQEDATKVSYYTPVFSGFQFGADFTPDLDNGGTAAGFTGENDPFNFENVFSAGINYTGEFEGVGIEASLVGELGDAEQSADEDLEAFGAGLVLSFEGFSLAGSYYDLGDINANDDAQYFTVGGAYEQDEFGISVTYLDSESGDFDLQNISVGADYQLAPGFVPYIEVNIFETDDGDSDTSDNEGTVVLLGTELSF